MLVIQITGLAATRSTKIQDTEKSCSDKSQPFKSQVKSHLPSAGIVTSSLYSPR